MLLFVNETFPRKLIRNLFQSLLISSSPANRARLLSESALHAASWLSVTPSVQVGLHLDPNELQTAIKWWLGLDTSGGSMCLLCPDTALDTLGHHAVTCRRGGDVVTRHNCLRDTFVDLCRNAHLSVQVEVGNNLTLDNSRPATVLVGNWDRGKLPHLNYSFFSPIICHLI